MIRALLLDLDNTLIDRDAAFDRLMSGWLGPDLAAARAMDGRGRTDRAAFCRAAWARWPGRWSDPAAFWAAFRDGIADAVRPDPAITRSVAALSKRYRLAVVSNGGSANQRRKMDRAALTGAFEAVFISGEVGWDKPDPRIFQAALEALGVAPGATMMVGDDPERDIAGAAALGIRTCWVAGPDADRVRADLVISGMAALPGSLETARPARR